jgi:FkbM family methyltransferase
MCSVLQFIIATKQAKKKIPRRKNVLRFFFSPTKNEEMGGEDKYHGHGGSMSFRQLSAITIGIIFTICIVFVVLSLTDHGRLSGNSDPSALMKQIMLQKEEQATKFDEIIMLLREIAEISAQEKTQLQQGGGEISRGTNNNHNNNMESENNNNKNNNSNSKRSIYSPFHDQSRCEGESMVINGVTAYYRPTRSGFDASTASSDPNFGVLKWGPGIVMMTHGASDSVSQNIIQYGLWEAQNMMIMMALAIHFKEKGEQITFLDIGSNLGLFGLFMASYGHQVFMFEPVAQNLDRICENVQLNNVGANVVVVPAGIAEKRKDLHMNIPTNNFGNSRIVASDGHQKSVAIALDEAWADLNVPNDRKIFIKVDVEGLEMSVADGAKRIFALPNVIGIMFEHDYHASPPLSYRVQRLKEIKEAGRFDVYCCAKCQDVTKDHGRCIKVDIEDEEEVKTHGAELMFIKPQYLNIIDRFNCYGEDWDLCLPPKK